MTERAPATPETLAAGRGSGSASDDPAAPGAALPATAQSVVASVVVQSPTAGSLLRAARQAQGLHIAALAASIKVTQRKLESLEADRYQELPDMTFTRALAKTVCRSLKIDAAPVLALLPQLDGHGLDRVHQGLNTTFRERPGRLEPSDLGVLKRPALWVPLLLVLVAAGLYWLPQSWLPDVRSAPPVVGAASPPPAPASSAAVVAATQPPAAEAVPAFPPEPASGPATPPPELTGALQLRVSGESWIEVIDASGASLLQRMLQPGEVVGLDGTPPFKVKIGNATVTTLTYRGQPVELTASTRDNVARLELR